MGNKIMQILLPISSRSPFFPKEEYFFPKPLIEIAGRPMIDLVVSQIQKRIDDHRFIFVVDREDVATFSIDRILKLSAGDGTLVIERTGNTSGALCSCLLAVDDLDPEAPLIVMNSDQFIAADLGACVENFKRSDAEAGVIVFDSMHPRWSYVVSEGDNLVVQTVEKKVVSRKAIAGFYYFKKARLFIEAAQNAILKNASVDDLFYISAAINEVILAGGKVIYSEIDSKDYHSFYAPSKLVEFERSREAAVLRGEPLVMENLNVIIPAAGQGSRFAKAGWKKPKPFIDVESRPMLAHVIENVAPRGAQVTLLLRSDHISAHPDLTSQFEKTGARIVRVEALTEGTACTVLLARKQFDTDRPMLVANSDQLVDFDVSAYVRDCFERELDGSILVFRDPTKDPKWSFARVDENGLVLEVAEKKPISDLATVGIYLFARGSDFVAAAVDMIAENERVNGEFYTCPVYNYMIKNGARIGVFEVPMEAMSGLGTPEDLLDFLERRDAPSSLDAPGS